MDRHSFALEEQAVSILSCILRRELLGKTISLAKRSAATVVVLKINPTRTIADNLGSPREIGYLDVIVELAHWRVQFELNSISDASGLEEIDDQLPRLVGKEVADFSLKLDGELLIRFSDSTRFVATPSGCGGRLSEWVVYRDEFWNLAYESQNGFLVEA